MSTLDIAPAEPFMAPRDSAPGAPERASAEQGKKHTRHIATLDGMRGLAAFAVLFRHVEYTSGLSERGAPLLPHAFLAVDFFYMLSGFVVALAYERKLLSMLPIRRFLLIRGVRLYPLIVAGALLGATSLALHSIMSPDFTFWQVLSASVSGFFVLPSNALMPLNNQKFPANTPEWSLFFELFVNVLYAVIVRWLTTSRLIGVCLLSAAGLTISAAHLRDLDGGWSHETFWFGFIRVLFPFFMGVLLCRIPARQVFGARLNALLAVVLVAILFSPLLRGSWLLDLGTILFCFPALVWLGAACRSQGWVNKAWLWLGAISYPLYITHNPLLRILSNFFRIEHFHSKPMMLVLSIALSAGFAYALLHLYDEPARAWLQSSIEAWRQRLQRRASVKTSALDCLKVAPGETAPRID